jgi:hypothetical protein
MCPISITKLKTYQWYYDFAIRMCVEAIRSLQLFPNNSVVVDFAVDGQGDVAIVAEDGLCAAVYRKVSCLYFEKKIFCSIPMPTMLRRS